MSRANFIDTISALDARSDQQIQSYYVETAALRRIRSSGVSSIGMVGLKGSGKTTLFRLLTEDWAGESKIIRVGLSPDRAEFAAYFDRLNCLQFANSVREGMCLFLAELIDENIKLLPEQERSRLSPWLERKMTILKPGAAAFSLIKRLKGLQILGCGIEIGESTGHSADFKLQRIPAAESSAIWDLLTEFKKYNLNIRIVVDDPDRLFTHQGKSDPHLLAGYILGTNEISKLLPYVQFVHILKSNIFNDLGGVEEMANLPHDYFDYISWSKVELGEMIKSRLAYANVVPEEIFEESVDDAVDELSKQIRNGPRDILRYLEIILKSHDSARVSPASISENKIKFKKAARRQMTAVYADIYHGIEPFIGSIFEGSEELTYATFRDRFLSNRLSSQPTGVDYAADWLKTSDRAFQSLIETGTVDVKTEEGWRRPYEPGYFNFDSGENALIRRTAVFI